MFFQTLADGSQSEKVVIITFLGSQLGLWITMGLKMRRDRVNRELDMEKEENKVKAEVALREQSRLDEESKANVILLALQAQEIRDRAAAAARLEVIRGDIKDNTAKTEEAIAKAETAIDVSNGHKKNLTEALDKVATVSGVIADAVAARAEGKVLFQDGEEPSGS